MMIDQTLKCALAISTFIVLATWVVFGSMNALALLSGILWGGINLYLIAGIVEALLVSKRFLAAVIMMLLKFPLLYGVGYLLLTVHVWNIWFLLAGPPIAFLLMAINVLWRYSMRSA